MLFTDIQYLRKEIFYVEHDMKPIGITKDRLLKILIDAYDIGNNGQNMNLKSMLKYLENKLSN